MGYYQMTGMSSIRSEVAQRRERLSGLERSRRVVVVSIVGGPDEG